MEPGSLASASDVGQYTQRSNSADTNHRDGANGHSKKKIFDPPYFAPLAPDDEFDVFDIELAIDVAGKQADVLVRARSSATTTSARPTYKVEKKSKSHLLGKSRVNMFVSRSEAWDSIQGKPVQVKGKGYITLLQATDCSPRNLQLTATKGMVLYSTSFGKSLTLAPFCGAYDPQRSRAPQPRAGMGLGYHFAAMNITEFERAPPPPPAASPIALPGAAPVRVSPAVAKTGTPAALTKPYSGGGYLIFDAHSHGRGDLLCTLYCTGYERRHNTRKGDIVLAELRLTRPASPSNPAGSQSTNSVNGNQPPSLWKRLFRERHATLHISRRGTTAVFTGSHVNMCLPNPRPGDRYTFTSGQAQEIVLSLFSTSLLAIEHDGLESKKWAWLLRRESLERGGEQYPHLTAPSMKGLESGFEHMSVTDTSSVIDHPAVIHQLKPDSSFDNWKVVSYNSSIGEAMLRSPSGGGNPTDTVSTDEFDADERAPFPHHTHTHAASAFNHSQSSSSVYSDEPQRQLHRRASTMLDRMDVSEQRQDVSEPLANWMDNQDKTGRPRDGSNAGANLGNGGTEPASEAPVKKPKEGPKVTGKPKPGVDGGIYW